MVKRLHSMFGDGFGDSVSDSAFMSGGSNNIPGNNNNNKLLISHVYNLCLAT